MSADLGTTVKYATNLLHDNEWIEIWIQNTNTY